MNKGTLDEIGDQNIIHYNYGGGSNATKGFGYVLMVLGILATYNTFTESEFTILAKIISIGLVLFGAFMAFTTRGVFVNTTTKESKKYTKIYWMKFGKWEHLDDYPCITILSKSYSSSITSRSNLTANLGSEMFYELNLLDNTHRKKYLLNSFPNVEDAKKAMHVIATKMKVDIVKYNPVVSQKTKNRRR